MSDLEAGRVAAKSGKPDSLVILLHGYGADGNDLLGLADPLGPYLPNTTFLAPNAPNRCSVNPMGYEWFPIPWIDGSSAEAAATGMARAFDILNRFLDRVAEEEGIAPDRTVLVGFSQGTMMALHVAPRRPSPFAGIVGFSGRLLAPERLAAEAVSKPPVLLVHGDADDVVPHASMAEAEAALKAAGFEVDTHTSAGMGHGIGPDGLGLAMQFIRAKLGMPQAT